jgi:hypothetical protein
MTPDDLKEMSRNVEPWPEREAAQLSRTAWREYFVHSYAHGARRDPDNCQACALQMRPIPNYSGWLRLFIQAGIRAPRRVMLQEAERAQKENAAYFSALLRDIATFKPGWII